MSESSTEAEITPLQAFERLSESEIIVIDVRSRPEWEQARLSGAVHIPLAELANEIKTAVPDQAQPLVLVCAVGKRSAKGAETLRALGYRAVSNLAGGIGAWQAEGLPVISALSPIQRDRYSRQTLLPEIGLSGQQALSEARVLVIGAGGLGSPALLYLAAAGVGLIGIIDDDVVDLSNLQRQVAHSSTRIGEPKTSSAAVALAELNPEVEVREHRTRLDAANALELLADYDLIVDGTDNFPTRYLVNDAAVRLRLPVISASILGFDGQISTFAPHLGGPCYRCLYPIPPPVELAPSCGEAGVLGGVAGTLGTMQATEALKLITGAGETLVGRVLLWDALRFEATNLKAHRDPTCPTCGPGAEIGALGAFPDYELFCAVPVREAVAV